MDAGIAALLAGLALVCLIELIPARWLRAAGGVLVLATALFVLYDGIRLFFFA